MRRVSYFRTKLFLKRASGNFCNERSNTASELTEEIHPASFFQSHKTAFVKDDISMH